MGTRLQLSPWNRVSLGESWVSFSYCWPDLLKSHTSKVFEVHGLEGVKSSGSATYLSGACLSPAFFSCWAHFEYWSSGWEGDQFIAPSFRPPFHLRKMSLPALFAIRVYPDFNEFAIVTCTWNLNFSLVTRFSSLSHLYYISASGDCT